MTRPSSLPPGGARRLPQGKSSCSRPGRERRSHHGSHHGYVAAGFGARARIGARYRRLLRGRHPQVKVAVLSVVSDQAEIARAFEHGACAYIVKSIDTSDLAAALRQAVSGAFYGSCDVSVGRVRVCSGRGVAPTSLPISGAVAGCHPEGGP
ncbi:MAG: hypothetical protein C4299_03865 [Thermoleophilia bacterium]